MTLDEVLSRYDPKQEARLRPVVGGGPNAAGPVRYIYSLSARFGLGGREVLSESLVDGHFGPVLEVVI